MTKRHMTTITAPTAIPTSLAIVTVLKHVMFLAVPTLSEDREQGTQVTTIIYMHDCE